MMTIPGLLTHLAPHGVHVCMVRVKEAGGLLEITVSFFSILFQKNGKEKTYLAIITRLQADHGDAKFGELLS